MKYSFIYFYTLEHILEMITTSSFFIRKKGEGDIEFG